VVTISYGFSEGLSESDRQKVFDFVSKLEKIGVDIPDTIVKEAVDESFTVSEAYDMLMDYIQRAYPEVYKALKEGRQIRRQPQGPSEAKSGKLKLKFKKPEEEERREARVIEVTRKEKRSYSFKGKPPYAKPVSTGVKIPVRSRKQLINRYLSFIRNKPKVQIVTSVEDIPVDKPVELRLRPPSENVVDTAEFLENLKLPESCEASRIMDSYGRQSIKIVCSNGEDAKKIAYALKQYFMRAYVFK